MRLLATFHFLLGFAVLAAPFAQAASWDFEQGVAGWRQPDGGSVIAEPGSTGNHAYQILAKKPHHTKLMFEGNDVSPNFLASARFRVLSSEGAKPTIFLYGRNGKSGYRGLRIGGGSAQGFFWVNEGGQRAETADSVRLPETDCWIHAKLACYGEFLFAKCWAEGRREPRWQIFGKHAGVDEGTFGLGVWLPPGEASEARVLFDDVEIQPITEADLAAFGLRLGPRPPLKASDVRAKPGVFETADYAGLATPSTVVAFDRNTGELAHLLHRATGQDFVSSAGGNQSLFKLTLTKPHEGKQQEVAAIDFLRLSTSEPQPGTLELTFTDHAALPLVVRVRASADADGLVHLGFALSNPTDWTLCRNQFPNFVSPPCIGETVEDDRAMLPGFGDLLLVEAPGAHDTSSRGVYPEAMPIQFVAYYDPAAGLYMATYDANANYKIWTTLLRKDRFVQTNLTHLRPEVHASESALPYDVVLGTFTGDWRDAATIYKRWAKQQPWCEKRITQRDDIPKYYLEGAAQLCVPFLHEKPQYELFSFDKIGDLPKIAAEYQKRTGMPHIGFAPFGWENRGAWAGINYFPARPSTEIWQEVSRAMNEQGNFIITLPSGFSWVVKRKATKSGPAFDDTADYEQRKGMTVHNTDGAPFVIDDYEAANSWMGMQVKLCHGSEDARKTAVDIFLGIARMGSSVIQFDQEIGGGQSHPCYSKEHGHTPGFGTWMWDGFVEVCNELNRRGRAVRPDFGLSIEGCSELAIPLMATQWGRQCAEVVSYRANGRTLGLFSYLYHEYMPVIGDGFSAGEGMGNAAGSAELRCFRLANTLARGLIPTVYMEQVPLEPKDDWRAKVSQAFFAYCRPFPHFPEYLLAGETLRPLPVECAEQELWHYQADEQGDLTIMGHKARKATIRRPTVVTGTFKAEDGSIGTVIVNASTVEQTAKLLVLSGARGAVLYRADRTEVQRWDKRPSEVPLTLEPFGVRMLILR